MLQFLEPKASRTLWCEASKRPAYLISPEERESWLLLMNFFAVSTCLHLGLLLEDVADRFGISSTMMSRLFMMWVLFLAKELYTVAFSLAKNMQVLISFIIPMQES